MDRRNYVPFLSVEDIDLLTQDRQSYIGFGRGMQAILGNNYQADGLTCTPTTPASLSVNVNIRSLYVEAAIDTTPYGNLPADANLFTKQGINFTATQLTLTPPATPGESINYLVQGRIVTTDTASETRQFRDNDGNQYDQSLNQDRTDRVVFSLVAGTPAQTDSQSTPAPDSGNCGCFVVTVDNGQTEIESGDIVRYTGSGAVIFLDEKLSDKISSTTGDARYAQLAVQNTFTQPQNIPQKIGSVTMNATQVIPSGNTATKVNFNTVERDDYNMFDAINNRFVAQETGWHEITAILFFRAYAAPSARSCFITVFKNNLASKRISEIGNNSIDITLSGSVRIYLNVNDYIEIYANNASSTENVTIGQDAALNPFEVLNTFLFSYLGP